MAKKQTDLDDVLTVIGDLTSMFSKRFDQVDVQLFKQGEDIKTLKTDIVGMNAKIDHIYGALDSHIKHIETILQENTMRDHQQQRMERWIFQLADKMGLQLKYDS